MRLKSGSTKWEKFQGSDISTASQEELFWVQLNTFCYMECRNPWRPNQRLR